MTAPPPPPPSQPPPTPPPPSTGGSWWSRLKGWQKGGVVLIVLIVVAGVALLDDEQDQVVDNSPSTSATESTSPQEITTVPEAPAVSQATSSLAPASGTSYTENDIEYMLAVVDKGGFVPHDDPVIKRYDQALDALEPKCTESRTLIADQSVGSVQLLADSGVVTNALEMLRAADDSIPPELGETRCSGIFAVLIVLMQG